MVLNCSCVIHYPFWKCIAKSYYIPILIMLLLGSVLDDAEIKIRIGMAKNAFQKMEKVIKNKNITIETRNRILQCYVIPILTYGSECWTIITKHGQKVGSHINVVSQKNATHILEGPCHKWWCIEERKNREEIDEQNQSAANEFPGTYNEKHGLENIVVTGKIGGERSRGRPRLNFMKSLSQPLKISEVEIMERTRNREEWRTMTANVRIGYGTWRERGRERERERDNPKNQFVYNLDKFHFWKYRDPSNAWTKRSCAKL